MSSQPSEQTVVSVVDTHERPLRSLRLSVTDRCNLRCQYCMPEEDYVWLPREDVLSFEEMARDRFIVGDKVKVKEEIARWKEELGVDHFSMRVQWPGLPQEKVLASIRRLGEIFA